MRAVPKTRKLSTRSSSRVWTWPFRSKEVKDRDAKERPISRKQSTLTAKAAKSRDSAKTSKAPSAASAKRESSWRRK